MAAKKLNRLEDLGGLVYSTDENQPLEREGEERDTPPAHKQELEAHLEKKGRGGKVAVLIKGFVGEESALKDLAKALKSHCATGGSVKNGEIVIQGPQRDKVMDYLRRAGYRVKRVGG